MCPLYVILGKWLANLNLKRRERRKVSQIVPYMNDKAPMLAFMLCQSIVHKNATILIKINVIHAEDLTTIEK